jgi:hypothetical protein
MTIRRNAAARAVRSSRFRPGIVRSRKEYRRRPKHPARAADAFRGCGHSCSSVSRNGE